MMIQNQWRSENCIGGKDLVIDNHLDQTDTFLIDRLCHLQEGVLLYHKDIVVTVLFHQEDPGTITVILHLHMVVALHHRKDIVMTILFHQEDLVLHHLGTTAQLTNSVEAMALLTTENTKEVQQMITRPLETRTRVDHTGERQQTLGIAPKDLIRKRSTLIITLNPEEKKR